MTRRFLCLALLATLLPSPVFAGNWGYEGTFTQEVSYHSNRFLQIDGAKSLYGSTTTPSLIIKNEMPTASVLFKNSVSQNLFTDSAFNSTDFHHETQLRKNSERWEAALKGSFDYDTTRTSELTTFGQTARNTRHWGYNITPSLSYAPTVYDKFTLSGGMTSSRYDSRRHTDYYVYSSGLSWAHALTAFSTTMLSVDGRRYQTRGGLDETVDSIGPSIGWRMAASETLTTFLSAGLEATKQSRAGTTVKDWSWNSVFAGSVAYQDQQHNLELRASRRQQPYSNASSSILTSFGVTERYRFNENFSGRVGGTYQTAKQSDLSTDNLDSRLSAQAGITYHWLRQCDVDAVYRYRNEKLTNTSTTQTDNAVLLKLVYRPEF